MSNFNRDERSGPRRDFGRRDFRKRDSGGYGGRREMYKAVCAECGKECEIPFEPKEGRPVYCSDCFEKKDGGSQAPRNFQDRGSRRSDFERRREIRPQNNEQFDNISHKLDKILEMLTASPLKEEKEVKIKPIKTKTVDGKKPEVSKKKSPAKK